MITHHPFILRLVTTLCLNLSNEFKQFVNCASSILNHYLCRKLCVIRRRLIFVLCLTLKKENRLMCLAFNFVLYRLFLETQESEKILMKRKYISIIGASLLILCLSCTDNKSKIDTSQAIRSGNFLASADFSDLSVLNIRHKGNVKSSFKDNVATFEYSVVSDNNMAQSTSSFATTEISYLAPVMVELTPGDYTVSFDYYFDVEDDSDLSDAIQNIRLRLEFTPVPLTDDLIPTSWLPLELGGRDEIMKKEWARYEKKTSSTKSEFVYLQFKMENISKVESNNLHIRNIRFAKD